MIVPWISPQGKGDHDGPTGSGHLTQEQNRKINKSSKIFQINSFNQTSNTIPTKSYQEFLKSFVYFSLFNASQEPLPVIPTPPLTSWQVSVSFHKSAGTIPALPRNQIKESHIYDYLCAKTTNTAIFRHGTPNFRTSVHSWTPHVQRTNCQFLNAEKSSSLCLKQMDVGSLCGGWAFRQRFHNSSILMTQVAPIRKPSKQKQQY